MSDLIRREDAIDALKKRWNNMSRTAKLEELVWDIERIPSVEPEERTAKVVDVFCSNCGRALIGNESYCPGCGAKLERK